MPTIGVLTPEDYRRSDLGWDYSPLSGAKPKLTSYSHSPCSKPHSTRFLVPTGIVEPIPEPNRFLAGTTSPAGAKILFGSVNPPKNTRGYPEICGGVFGHGESEYEVIFGLAPQNRELSPSDSEHRNLLALHSGPETQNGVQIRIPRKIWGRLIKLWGLVAYIPRDKRSMVKMMFFDFRGGEIAFFLTRQTDRCKYPRKLS